MKSTPMFCVLAAMMLFPGLHTGASAQTCTAAPWGIVGWWPGNGTAIDIVGGNNGQLAGDAAFAPAVVGLGFSLDGEGDYVQIPDAPALKPARVSVEAWVRFDSLDTPVVSQFGAVGLQYVIFKKNTRTFNFEAYALRKQREAGVDRLVFSVGDVEGGGTTTPAVSTTAVVPGEFYHVVGTYDGSYVRLYVNGQLEAEAPVSIVVDYGTRPIFIGTSGETVFDGKLNGIVDEASIYNRALGAQEVAALYASGNGGKCPLATGLLSGLAAFVQALNLSNGIANSFDVKLRHALRALDAANHGDSPAACNALRAFMHEVEAQTDRALTAAQASQLAGAAKQVAASMECRR